jgi:hypothetical protein
MTTHSLLNTTGSNYDDILTVQAAAFTWENFTPRLSIDWTKAIIRVFAEAPTWDAVIQNFSTALETRQYIEDNDANWNTPESI